MDINNKELGYIYHSVKIIQDKVCNKREACTDCPLLETDEHYNIGECMLGKICHTIQNNIVRSKDIKQILYNFLNFNNKNNK